MSLRHYPLIFRRLFHKSFSVLNILGLAIGIGAALLIFLVIRYETGFDRSHANRQRIYRVVASLKSSDGQVDYDGCTPLPVPVAIRKDFPQFEQVAAVWSMGKTQFTILTCLRKHASVP